MVVFLVAINHIELFSLRNLSLMSKISIYLILTMGRSRGSNQEAYNWRGLSPAVYCDRVMMMMMMMNILTSLKELKFDKSAMTTSAS